jgi:hypothetical protein
MKKIILLSCVFAAWAPFAFANDFIDQMVACSQSEEADPEGADPYQDYVDSIFPNPMWDEDETPSCGVLEYAANSSKGAPVMGPFLRNLKSCAPGCAPVDYNAYRSQSNSCHNTGRALDVHGIQCGGKTHMAINGGRFAEIVRCMKGKMHVLYRNGPGTTSGHHDHGHFSIGCSIPGHPNYW